MLTPFEELDTVLADFTGSVRHILSDSFVGAYLQGVRWLFCDHGHRELIWDTHCNSAHSRWILRHHGITIAGPPAADLVDEVPPQALRDEARRALPEVMTGLTAWHRSTSRGPSATPCPPTAGSSTPCTPQRWHPSTARWRGRTTTSTRGGIRCSRR
jgi:hypothetical protein